MNAVKGVPVLHEQLLLQRILLTQRLLLEHVVCKVPDIAIMRTSSLFSKALVTVFVLPEPLIVVIGGTQPCLHGLTVQVAPVLVPVLVVKTCPCLLVLALQVPKTLPTLLLCGVFSGLLLIQLTKTTWGKHDTGINTEGFSNPHLKTSHEDEHSGGNGQ